MLEAETSAVVEALMAVVDGGVLVCDAGGTVVRHDAEAVRLLCGDAEGGDTLAKSPARTLVGRAAADFVDARLLATAFRTVRDRAAESAPVVFVTPGPSERLIRVAVRPVATDVGAAPRVLVHLQPKRAWSEAQPMSHQLLGDLIESMRAPLASVRAAIETMTQYPSMGEAAASQFQSIIEEQTVELGERLEAAVDAYATLYRSAWPLDAMSATGLVQVLADHVRRAVDVPVRVDTRGAASGEGSTEGPGNEPGSGPGNEPGDLLRVRADVFALSHAMVFLGRRVVNAARCARLTLRLRAVRRFAAVDLAWTGPSVSVERLRKWESETLTWGDTIVEMTLREIIDHHDAQIWSHHDGDAARLRLLLPAQRPQ